MLEGSAEVAAVSVTDRICDHSDLLIRSGQQLGRLLYAKRGEILPQINAGFLLEQFAVSLS